MTPGCGYRHPGSVFGPAWIAWTGQSWRRRAQPRAPHGTGRERAPGPLEVEAGGDLRDDRRDAGEVDGMDDPVALSGGPDRPWLVGEGGNRHGPAVTRPFAEVAGDGERVPGP